MKDVIVMLYKVMAENEENIEKFKIDEYFKNKNYPIVAALSALNTTNEIQKCYFNLPETSNSGERALRLYALLQGLFVSIDSLYALAYSLTKSKKIININRNQTLRELKYIRNDVVGHPATRMLSSNTLAYCILDDQKITSTDFVYKIYSGTGIEEKKVVIEPLVTAYYVESNRFLKELYLAARESQTNGRLTTLAIEALDSYEMGGEYDSKLVEIRKLYLKKYPNATSAQHRVIWRLDAVELLKNYQTEQKQIKAVAQYAIGLELIKLYQLLSGKVTPMNLRIKTPEWVSSFYRFLRRFKDANQHVEKILDIKHPLFLSGITELMNLAKNKNYIHVLAYLTFIRQLYDEQNDDLLYGFTLPLRAYKKNK